MFLHYLQVTLHKSYVAFLSVRSVNSASARQCRVSVRLQLYKIFKITRTSLFGSFWTSLSLRPQTETKRLNFGLSPELRLTNHCSASSLTSSATHRCFAVFFCLFWICVKVKWFVARQNLICNWLTYLVHAKSTGELMALDSATAQSDSDVWSQRRRLRFLADLWSISNLELSESLSERLIQLEVKVIW